MKTWIRACSVTLREVLRESLEGDPDLDAFFAPAQGGTMLVTLDTPQEMAELAREGASLWLYRLQRDGETLNHLPRRVGPGESAPRPLPLRLHYLVTPIVDHATQRRRRSSNSTSSARHCRCYTMWAACAARCCATTWRARRWRSLCAWSR